MNRIDQLNEMLSASLTPEGKPAKGFTKRVAAIRAELRNLANSADGRRQENPPSEQG